MSRIQKAGLAGGAAGAIVLVLSLSGPAFASTILLGWNTDEEALCSINTATHSCTHVGTDPAYGYIAEIEYRNGVVYGADTDDNTKLHLINPASGAALALIALTFPDEGDVLTALEFVGDTLYAGLTTEGGGPTYLSTVDLGTGVVTVVGSTGFGSPMGGLSYDGTTMYAISAGGSAPKLFTVSLTTGLATVVGPVTLGGQNFGGTTALEFGNDGVLYALPNYNSDICGHLLALDPLSGNATDLGDTETGLTSLTVPEPSSIALLVLLGLLGGKRCRCSKP